MNKAVKHIRRITVLLLILSSFSVPVSTGSRYFLGITFGFLLLIPAAPGISSFNKRNAAFLFCCTALILTGGCTSPKTEDNGSGRQDSAAEDSVKTEPGKTVASKKAPDKDDISSWLYAEFTGSESAFTAEDIKTWEKNNQNAFYKIWRKSVLKQIKGWEDTEDYQKTAEEITRSCSIYKKICTSEKENAVKTLLQDAETVSCLAKENKKLQDKYSFDILSDRDMYSFNTYYINRQLETAYSDNLVGKIQKEAESYQSKDYLDWVAYNVDYLMNEPVRGDTCLMIIRTKTDEPFAKAGAYYLAYTDTGKTMTLIDSRGFSQEVPVCRMLGNGDIVEKDFSQYIDNTDTCFSLCWEMEQFLKTGKSERIQENTDSETNPEGSRLNAADNDDDLGDWGQYYIICDSNERFLDRWDFDEMDAHTLSLARNEIFARHGRRFHDKEIQTYFDSMPWYEGTVEPEDFDDSVFNQYEKANLKKIAEIESESNTGT